MRIRQRETEKRQPRQEEKQRDVNHLGDRGDRGIEPSTAGTITWFRPGRLPAANRPTRRTIENAANAISSNHDSLRCVNWRL